jgi:hypothetical protein
MTSGALRFADGRAAGAGALVVLAVLAALAGALLGVLAHPGHSDPAATPTVSAGDVVLTVPSSWVRDVGGPQLAGLDGPGTVSLDTGASRMSVGEVPPGGPSLLPAAMTRNLAAPLPAPVAVRAGTVTAYGYVGLAQRRPRTWFDVYAVPTTGGVVTLACGVRARDNVLLGLAAEDCQEALLSLRLTRGRALAPGPTTAFMLTIPRVIDRLAATRAAGRAELAATKGPVARSRAASSVSRAYAGARRALAPMSSGTADEVATLDHLAALAGAYGALAAAAAHSDASAFRTSSLAIRRSERALERALGVWRRRLASG